MGFVIASRDGPFPWIGIDELLDLEVLEGAQQVARPAVTPQAAFSPPSLSIAARRDRAPSS